MKLKMKSPRFQTLDELCFKDFSAENISFKMVKFQIVVEIGRWPESTKDDLPPIFWTFFWTSKNVHFALCAPPILNMKCKTSKIGFLTIMLTKRIFDPKKLTLKLFEGPPEAVGWIVYFMDIF